MNLSTLREMAAISDPIQRARALGRAMAEQQSLVEEAARMRRQAIAEARETGHRLEEIAGVLGVSPGRISQMRKGAVARMPTPAAEPRPQVIVHRQLPTEPSANGTALPLGGEREDVRLEARVLTVDSEPSSEHVATCLRVRPGDEIIARRHVILADTVPVRLVTSYFRADLFGGTRVAQAQALTPSPHAVIESLGHVFGHAEETLVARPALHAEAETLALDPGEWAVQILRASYSTEDVPVHVMETICAATRHVFTVSQAGGLRAF